MELREARQLVRRILDNEMRRPTVQYIEKKRGLAPTEVDPVHPVPQGSGLALDFDLISSRQEFSRVICETPEMYVLKSDNYELLLKIFFSVASINRPAFVRVMLNRLGIGMRKAYATPPGYLFPTFENCVSDLPLIAEFCIRNGFHSELFEAASMVPVPNHHIQIMLMQIAETIALNFTLFTEKQLGNVWRWLEPLDKVSRKQESKVGIAVMKSIAGIRYQCEQALYLHLKSALQLSAPVQKSP